MKKTLFVSLLVYAVLSTAVSANSYVYHHYKLHPVQDQSATKLSNQNLADATYYNQERLDSLRLELIEAKKEMQAMRDQMKEMEASFERFKTYYFRRL
jgi:hypothetical protein